jgi:hypothetical protein
MQAKILVACWSSCPGSGSVYHGAAIQASRNEPLDLRLAEEALRFKEAAEKLPHATGECGPMSVFSRNLIRSVSIEVARRISQSGQSEQ